MMMKTLTKIFSAGLLASALIITASAGAQTTTVRFINTQFLSLACTNAQQFPTRGCTLRAYVFGNGRKTVSGVSVVVAKRVVGGSFQAVSKPVKTSRRGVAIFSIFPQAGTTNVYKVSVAPTRTRSLGRQVSSPPIVIAQQAATPTPAPTVAPVVTSTPTAVGEANPNEPEASTEAKETPVAGGATGETEAPTEAGEPTPAAG